jgi:hypothetical protein
VNDIDPFNRVDRPLVAIAVMDELVPLEFDIRYAWDPTLMIVQHLTNSVSQLRVDGVIDNPIDRTELRSTSAPGDGSVILPTLKTGFGGLVRSNDLDIVTTQGGYSVNVQLVRSAGRPTHFTSVVGQNYASYLRVQGILRDPNVTDFVVQLDSIVTPGVMAIEYLCSEREVDSEFAQLLTKVDEVPLANLTLADNHFRPGDIAIFQQLPVDVFGTHPETIDSTYDFQSIIASFLHTQPFDEPCPGIDTELIVNWEKPGSVPGDFTKNGTLDLQDINDLIARIEGGTNPAAYDLNSDSKVDEADLKVWVKTLRKTWIGDSDLNGEFNSSDFVKVFTSGKYEQRVAAGWDEGDWNGDGRFTSSDFVSAFQDGGYENGPVPALAAVPESATTHRLPDGKAKIKGVRTLC